MSSKEIKLVVPAQEIHLVEVRDFVSQIARSAGFPSKGVNSIRLAVDEGCTNIIRHAYKDIPDGYIEVYAVLTKKSLVIVLVDKGKNFDFDKVSNKTPNIDSYIQIGKKGGLGLFLMKKLMDELDYRITSRGNELHLVKYRPYDRIKLLKSLITDISLRNRFMLFACGLFSVLMIAGFSYAYNVQKAKLRQQVTEQAISTAKSFAEDSKSFLLSSTIDDLELTGMAKNIKDNNPFISEAFIVDSNGIIQGHSSITEHIFEPFQPLLDGKLVRKGSGYELYSYDLPDDRVFQFISPVKLENSEQTDDSNLGRVYIRVLESYIDGIVVEARNRVIRLAGMLLLIGNIGIIILTYWMLMPFQRLVSWIRGTDEENISDNPDIETEDEVGEIAQALQSISNKFRKAKSDLREQEQLQQEVRVAQEIQHMLLPSSFPEIEGYDIASFYRAATEVGGDYFDFVWVDENTLGIAVADVSGKGVPGSLVMTMIRTALRLEARGNKSASDVLAKVNDFVTSDIKKGMFVTMFYIILDSRNRVINYASAGHNPIVLYRSNSKKSYYLNPEGFPVGLTLPEENLFSESIKSDFLRLEKGDLLIAYTDGITEAMNPQREQFGEGRFLDVIRKHGHKPVKEFVECIRLEIQGFTQNHPQNDDITLVAIQEKLAVEEVLFDVRSKLLKLVDEGGLSVKAACERMSVSTTTYYRYRKRFDEFGIEGLKDRIERSSISSRHVSLEDREKMFDIICKHPEYGAKRISQELNSEAYDFTELSDALIYGELKRLKLNSKRQRFEFVRLGGRLGKKKLQPAGMPNISVTGEVIQKQENKMLPSPTQEEKKRKGELDYIEENVSEVEESEKGEIKKGRIKNYLLSMFSDAELGEDDDHQEKRYDQILTHVGTTDLAGSNGSARVEDAKYEEVADERNFIKKIVPSMQHLNRFDNIFGAEIDDSLSNGIKYFVVDCNGLSVQEGLSWTAITCNLRKVRHSGGDIFLYNLDTISESAFRSAGINKIIKQTASVESLCEKLRASVFE